MGQPSHSQSPRPMIHSLSLAESHASSSVKSVTAWRQGQGSRVQSVPQNIRRGPNASYRSEEHTSELQSLRHLVCRLLLEKKKTKLKRRITNIDTYKATINSLKFT